MLDWIILLEIEFFFYTILFHSQDRESYADLTSLTVLIHAIYMHFKCTAQPLMFFFILLFRSISFLPDDLAKHDYHKLIFLLLPTTMIRLHN